MKIPDKLQIKTYLHELRTHFTGRQLEIKSVGDSPSLSSYVVNVSKVYLTRNVLLISTPCDQDDQQDCIKRQGCVDQQDSFTNYNFSPCRTDVIV